MVSDQLPLPPSYQSEDIGNVFKSSAEFCRVRSLADSPVATPPARETTIMATDIINEGGVGMPQTATFNRCPVTVLRDEGTPLEARWDTSMGGDFATYAIFDDGPQRVRSGDVVYCSLFSEPHVITSAQPQLVGVSVSGSNVAYWKAKIMPRSEWMRLHAGNQFGRLGNFGPDPDARKRKPVRQNQRYTKIDGSLKEIAEARPTTQEEVFQMLDERRVVTPPAEPFRTARGWAAGFERNEPVARAWLSKRWALLGLPTLPRGPKK
jgi:hypothetical protein